ncbi:uncharacterized protein LOC62_01G001608 [Vanrija pseudolonga]|uniref:Uncharacterized protein n=1 Tax=Vanrija pseudolonga TaxID=143232 RepID=A0AAF0Y174_9TREE|nr:hypothetical protein LOC62_01G001608 [Vanrija pseudolonga]
MSEHFRSLLRRHRFPACLKASTPHRGAANTARPPAPQCNYPRSTGGQSSLPTLSSIDHVQAVRPFEGEEKTVLRCVDGMQRHVVLVTFPFTRYASLANAAATIGGPREIEFEGYDPHQRPSRVDIVFWPRMDLEDDDLDDLPDEDEDEDMVVWCHRDARKARYDFYPFAPVLSTSADGHNRRHIPGDLAKVEGIHSYLFFLLRIFEHLAYGGTATVARLRLIPPQILDLNARP